MQRGERCPRSAGEVTGTQGARNRRHGHETERMVVRYLRDNGWPDARTTRSGLGTDGTRTPGDVEFEPGIVLEVKSVKQSAWPSWRAQALIEANGRIPVVVRRHRGVPDVGRWTTELRSTHWVDLGGTGVPAGQWCPRTGRTWVRVTFAQFVALLRDDS